MVSAAGFILSLVGGLLDFASGTSFLLRSTGPEGMTLYLGVPGAEWGVGLLFLGAAVIMTAVVSVRMAGMRSKNAISALMIVYGAAMLLTGWSMSSGAVMPMGGTSFYGYSMIAVGVLMAANGAAMARSPAM